MTNTKNATFLASEIIKNVTNWQVSFIISNQFYNFDRKVLDQFDKVELVLTEAIEIFKTDHIDVGNIVIDRKRKVRETPKLVKIPKCAVSIKELIELNKAIESALSNVTNTIRPINCELNFGNSDNNCVELMKQIQCGVNHMKNSYVKQSTTSLTEINKLTIAYEDLYNKYINLIDVVKKSVADAHKQELDKLQAEIHELGNILNIKLEQLKEITRKICVSEIHSGKIANAIEHYKELNDISKINKIIETSYTDYGKIDNVKNILEFILYLPNINHKIEAVQTLFIQMEQNNHLYSHQGFLFKHALSQSILSRVFVQAGYYGVDPEFNKLSEDQKNKLLSLRNKLTLLQEQNKIQNGKVLEYTRLVNHFELNMHTASIEECWDLCLNNQQCKSISFLHANRKSHYQLNCCFLYSSRNPQTSENEKEDFTSIIRNEYSSKCNCPCRVKNIFKQFSRVFL